MIDALGGVRGFDYDLRDNLTTVTNANGASNSFVYDQFRRPIKRTNPTGVWSFAYDAIDNLVAVRNPLNSLIEVKYDALSRLTDDGLSSFVYDSDGNLISAVSRYQTNTFAYYGSGPIASDVEFIRRPTRDFERYERAHLPCRRQRLD